VGKKGTVREAVTEYIDHARAAAAQHHLHTSVVSILSKKKLSSSHYACPGKA